MTMAHFLLFSSGSLAVARLVLGAEHRLGDRERAVGGRHAGIDRHMQQRLGDLAGVAPVFGGGAEMQRQLLGAAKRGQDARS